MDRSSIDRVMRTARQEDRRELLEHEGYEVLQAAGIAVPAHRFVPRGEPLQKDLLRDLGPSGSSGLSSGEVDDLVMKIVSPDILHKSDVGGVRIVRRELNLVRAAMAEMLDEVGRRAPQADLRGVLLVQKIPLRANVPGGEFLVSLRRDRAFGPSLMFGLGGLLTEWYGRLSEKRSHVILSASDFNADEALEKLATTDVGKLALRPSRLHAEPPVRPEVMQRTLQALAALAELRDEDGHWLLEELEMNPMAAVEGELLAIDALVRCGEAHPAARPARPIAKIRQLLHPRSAVIYGASATAQNAGRIILHNLKQSTGLDYGRLYAIHPKADRIEGVPCYRSAKELPETVDLAVISIPAALAPDAIEELVHSERAHSIILIPGGFAETGQRDLARRIQKTLANSRQTAFGGPVLVGGNCLGVVSKYEYNTFFLPSYKLPFSDAPGDELAAIGQSGAYLVTFTSNLDGVIFPRASISYGNEMDLTVSDFLEYYLEHETDPRVLAFYIEGLQPGEGERFCRLVRRATRDGRAVVVYKAGKTEFGAKAAASHTASVAGDYTVARSLLLQSGAIVCETLNMFEDYTKTLTMLHARRARGARVGVISNAGFEAGAVSDHLYALQMADFSESTRKALAEVLPDIAHVGNPIDATPMAQTRAFVQAVEIMAAAEEIDVLVVSAIPATPALDVLAPDLTGKHQENAFAMTSLPAELGRVFRETEKPMVVAIDSGRLYDPSVLLLERAGVPVYRKIDRASRALSALVVHQLGGRTPAH